MRGRGTMDVETKEEGKKKEEEQMMKACMK